MDIERVDLLNDLLGALFRSRSELDRFLVLEGIDADPGRNVWHTEQSKSAEAYDVAQALIAQDQADGRFFAALERRFPERATDIQQVAERFRQPDPYPGEETALGDDASPYADFTRRLSASLEALRVVDDTQLCLDDNHWPWTAPASVLGSFDPLDLKQLPRSRVDTPPMTALRDLVSTGHDGNWVLREEIRSACLGELLRRQQVDEALNANRDLTDRRRDLLAALLQPASPVLPLAYMERDELVDLDAVLGWLAPFDVGLPVTRTDVRAAVERRLLIDPLQSLVGTHFQGRKEELALLNAHLDGTTDDPLLLLRGAGGSGKSTLLGHVILKLEGRYVGERVAFAYIDFDKTRHDPRDSAALLRELAKQLRLLYATTWAAEEFAAVEEAYDYTTSDRAAEILNIDIDDADLLLETLCDRLLTTREGAGGDNPPLLLFFDTFEEVTAKGPGAVSDAATFVTDLWKRLPDMRAVIAGRTVPDTVRMPSSFRELGDLDPVAAQALLRHLGVLHEPVRQLVIDSFGSNPLTLRLAAEALQRVGRAVEAFRDVVPQSRALVDTAREQVQGMLYSRILGHIEDPEVASVAHPGLAVRLVTVDVLRDVLAGPCGIELGRAGEVFGKLRTEMSLFDVDADGSLRHRQDVRRIMLRVMHDDPQHAPSIADIHRRAVAYYHQRPGPVARTEELYHRLMNDEDPRNLDHLWEDFMVMGLSSALEEPLSPRAHRWLERRVVTGAAHDDVGEWEQEDWEANAYSRASSWLASGAPAEALDVLRERGDRLRPSRLYALEVAAQLSLGDVAAAATALETGMLRSQGSSDRRVTLELAEQAVAVRIAQVDSAGLAASALYCASAADLAGEPARGVRALATSVTELRRLGDDRYLPNVQAELVRRFGLMTREQMRQDPDLIRQVLHAAGAEEASVLAHAVVAVGDQTDDMDGVFLPDTFALSRLLDGTTPEAQPALARLAEEVGLRKTGWKTDQLASLLVRTGRTSLGLTLGLDFAEDKLATQAMVVNELVQPVHADGGNRS